MYIYIYTKVLYTHRDIDGSSLSQFYVVTFKILLQHVLCYALLGMLYYALLWCHTVFYYAIPKL